MFKKIILLCLITLAGSNLTASASAPRLDLKYENSGVISFVEPDDIFSYKVFYSNQDYDYGVILESDLSLCPSNQGLFCVAESVSRSGNRVFLNLKDSFRDTTIAIKYTNTDSDESSLSNAINLRQQVRNLDLSAYIQDEFVFLEVKNPENINLSKFNFRGYYKNGQTFGGFELEDFGGCRNYFSSMQMDCVSDRFEKVSDNKFRIEIDQSLVASNSFVFAYEDKFSSYVSMSNSVYFSDNDRGSPELDKIYDVKVNDAREIYFSRVDGALAYFVSYNKDYPGYSPNLDQLEFCALQKVESKCAIANMRTSGDRVFLRVRDDLPSAFFTVYYLGANKQVSPISRSVYIHQDQPIDVIEQLPSPRLSQHAAGQLSFAINDRAYRYFLVHTYGDRSGYLYKNDFAGCKYSSLSCAGFNIRKVGNRYFINIRPEKTGNRFALYYKTKNGQESELSNSIFIPRDETSVSEHFTDINFTEYFEAISYLKEIGVVKGYLDGTFRPFQQISRAEFLKILIESRFPEIAAFNPNYTCFYDVDMKDWFNKYVCFAQQKGIVSGYLDGSFRPNQAITLAEALKVAMDSFGMQTLDGANPLNAWFVKYLDSARAFGLLPVSSRTRPADHLINRGEMAYITYKILNN